MEDLTKKNSFLGSNFHLRIWSLNARVVVWNARVEGRFGCLRREMDISIEDLPYVIHVCFLLHNFCELHKDPAHQNLVEAAKKYDSEFQPTNKSSGYQTSDNESTGKNLEEYL